MASIHEVPRCPSVSGFCLAREATDNLGFEVYATLVMFIWGAEPGDRLALERVQTGFLLESTGGALSDTGVGIDQEHLRQLRERLEILRRIRPEE